MIPPNVQAAKYWLEKSSIFFCGVTAPGASGFPAVVLMIAQVYVIYGSVARASSTSQRKRYGREQICVLE